MSKTTKAIATLGIVAGLGVAALPLASYADTAVSGNVKVQVEVAPAIAMRIHSNADQTCSGDPEVCTDSYGFIGYQPATAQGSGDPAGIAGPSLATGLQLDANTSNETTLFSNIDVRSNTGSFSVSLIDADTDNRLNVTDPDTGTVTPSEVVGESIPAGVTLISGGENDGKIDGTIAGWAVKGGAIDNWTAVPVSTGTALPVVSSGTNATNPIAYSSSTTVNYGVASGLTKTGLYSDVVTYTATAR